MAWDRFRWNSYRGPLLLDGTSLVFPWDSGEPRGTDCSIRLPSVARASSTLRSDLVKNLHNRSCGGCENDSFHNLRKKAAEVVKTSLFTTSASKAAEVVKTGLFTTSAGSAAEVVETRHSVTSSSRCQDLLPRAVKF